MAEDIPARILFNMKEYFSKQMDELADISNWVQFVAFVSQGYFIF